MSLLEKLRTIQAEDPNRNLLDFLGIKPGDPFSCNAESLTVGNETMPTAEAKLAIMGGPIRTTPEPRRSVQIGDL